MNNHYFSYSPSNVRRAFQWKGGDGHHVPLHVHDSCPWTREVYQRCRDEESSTPLLDMIRTGAHNDQCVSNLRLPAVDMHGRRTIGAGLGELCFDDVF